MSNAWYGRAYRKLFFDFHTNRTATGLAASFNAEKWADRVAVAEAQAVTVFTKCAQGWSYYQKGNIRYRHPLLPEGLDMLEEQIQALHKRGIKVIGYYHTFNSDPMVQAHPEWRVHDKHGRPCVDNGICLLSPLTEEWMLPHIEEIVRHYEVDSMFFDGTFAKADACYCEFCRARFKNETGLELPVEKGADGWETFVEWQLRSFQDIRRRICQAIHRLRPEVVISFNWVYSLRFPEIVPEGVGALAIDITPDDQVFNGSFNARYWNSLAVPFDIMNTAFMQWWGDWACKPALAMQQEAATIIANGGCVWTGYQMTPAYEVPEAVMHELGKTMRFIKEREPWLIGARPVPHAAVLASTDNPLTAPTGPFIQTDVTSQVGLHKMLMEIGCQYQFLNEKDLLARLNEYAVVILSDQRYISKELADALANYVKAGGVLIATCLTGTLDDNYHPLKHGILEKLLGVSIEGVCDKYLAYIEVRDKGLKRGALDMPHMIDTRIARVRPVSSQTKTLAKLLNPYLRSDGKYLLACSPAGEDSGLPAITLKKTGKGASVYMAPDIFLAYKARNQWNLKVIFANLLDKVVAKKPVTVESPLWLETVATRQDNRMIVHLVNHHCNRPLPGGNICAEQIPVVRDVMVKIRVDRKPARVTLEPGKLSPEWGYSSGIVWVKVPQVHIHTLVVLSR